MNKPIDQRSVTRSYKVWLLVLSVLISGCDGGIFGTGDGGKDTIIPVPEDSGSPETPPEMPGPGTDIDTIEDNLEAVPFENSDSTTNRIDALLRLINASNDPNLELVFINNNMVESPLVPLPGLSTTTATSNYITLPTAANSISVFAASDALDGSLDSPLAQINPLIVVSGSATTLVARGSFSETVSTFQLLPIKTRTTSGNGTALVRVIHAALLSGDSRFISVDLLPVNSPDTIVNVTTNLEYSALNSEYREIDAGSYDVDVTGRGNDSETIAMESNLTLVAGEAVTLVITNQDSNTTSLPGNILVVRDMN